MDSGQNIAEEKGESGPQFPAPLAASLTGTLRVSEKRRKKIGAKERKGMGMLQGGLACGFLV